MLKKIRIISCILGVSMFTLIKPEHKDNVFYQLLDVAYTVTLSQRQERLLYNCLTKDCQACNTLLSQMQQKRRREESILDDAAKNGKRLDSLIKDPHLTEKEITYLLTAFQKTSNDYLKTLDTFMPGEYNLFKYECIDSNKEDLTPQTYYVLLITDKENVRLLIYKNTDTLNDLQHCNFEETPLGHTTNELCTFESSHGNSLVSKQIIKKKVWQGTVGDTTMAQQANLKLVCVRSGSLVELLSHAHTAQLDDIIEKIKAVIATLSNT